MSNLFNRSAEKVLTNEERRRKKMKSALVLASDETVDEWLALDNPEWVSENADTFYAAGLSAEDVVTLYRSLDKVSSKHISKLISQGRLAGIEVRWVHLWADGGVLKALPPDSPSRGGYPDCVKWVSDARKFFTVCDGDQRLGALASAAGLGVEEFKNLWLKGEASVEALRVMASLRFVEKDKG